MKYFLHPFSYICFCLILSGCSYSQNTSSIIPLKILNYVDTTIDRGEQIISKTDFFLVQNFQDGKLTEDYIDKFVETHKDSNLNKYAQYTIVFYKESERTTLANITANKRIIDRYSQENDWIYSYRWSNGKFLSKWEIRDGELVDPKDNIIIENIPDTTNMKR